jgi:hypothetical protein
MGGTAIDVDVLASFYDVELYTNTLQGGVHGAGGNSTSLNVETFGGSTCVHATGNTTTGGFRLTNGGGTLGITQANIGDLSIDNGFVSVAIIGGITYNC